MRSLDALEVLRGGKKASAYPYLSGDLVSKLQKAFVSLTSNTIFFIS